MKSKPNRNLPRVSVTIEASDLDTLDDLCLFLGHWTESFQFRSKAIRMLIRLGDLNRGELLKLIEREEPK
jgi:hypothetical protein